MRVSTAYSFGVPWNSLDHEMLVDHFRAQMYGSFAHEESSGAHELLES